MDDSPRGHTDLLVRHKAEVELMKDEWQRNNCLHQSKLVTYALPWATTEGHIPVVGSFLGGQALVHREPLGLVCLGVLQHVG